MEFLGQRLVYILRLVIYIAKVPSKIVIIYLFRLCEQMKKKTLLSIFSNLKCYNFKLFFGS